MTPSTTTTSSSTTKRARRSTDASSDPTTTQYEDVTLNKQRGSLRLSNDSLCFEASDGSRKIKIEWEQLAEHMISPATSDRTLLRVVSKKNNARILKLPDRDSLVQVRNDITKRRSSTTKDRRSSAPVHLFSSSNAPKPQLRKTKSHTVRVTIREEELRDVSDPGPQSSERRKLKPMYNWSKHKRRSERVLNGDKADRKESTREETTDNNDITWNPPETNGKKEKKHKEKKKKKKKDKEIVESAPPPLQDIESKKEVPLEAEEKKLENGEPEKEISKIVSALDDNMEALLAAEKPEEAPEENEAKKSGEPEIEESDKSKIVAAPDDDEAADPSEIAPEENEEKKSENEEPEHKPEADQTTESDEKTESAPPNNQRFRKEAGRQSLDGGLDGGGSLHLRSFEEPDTDKGNDYEESFQLSGFGNSNYSLSNSLESMADDEILKATGLSLYATEEEKQKAIRKSRRSIRMNSRMNVMNASRQQMNSSGAGSSAGGSSTRLSMGGARMSTRKSLSRRGSERFVLFKDLEERDEFQKVQAGAFLRELYKTATTEAKEHFKDQIRMSANSSAGGGNGTKDGISLEGMDLAEFTREQAKSTIEKLHAGGKLEPESLIQLIQAGVGMLGNEDTVIDLRELHPTLNKVTAVGDLHGSLECVMVVLKLVDFENMGDNDVIVFDGDFVDRGHNSLEVIVTLLLLKLSHPKNVFLLRGNHEDSMTASSYGFRDEVDEKYGYDKGDEIWWEFGILFAAFPIVARSNTAAIMHGGIPVEEFDLNDLNELAKETRCEMKTISDPYDDDERLLQGILWSDPSEEMGINFSDRGAGFTFGPDITADFLDRHDLKLLIRAHEVVETGHCHHDVGEGRGVITIFSSANYPAGEGTNHGAVLFLDDQTGKYETKDFIHKENQDSQEENLFHTFLKTFVDGHKSQLTKVFRAKQDENGHVTTEQWADVISELLDLPDISLTWLDMQEELAPTTAPDSNAIDWTDFLNKYTTVPTVQALAKDELAALSEIKDKFLDIFQLIDTSGDGLISKDEFVEGMKMLNQQTGDDTQNIDDAEKLFHIFDVDNSGEISIDEFSQALQKSSELKDVAEALKDDQVEQLKHNQDMIATTFKYLDADKNLLIDRDEFQEGFETLNKRMPDRNKFGKHEDWFNMFELNDQNQIDFNAFKHVFCAI